MSALSIYITLIFGTYLLFCIQNSLSHANIRVTQHTKIHRNSKLRIVFFTVIAMVPIIYVLTNRYMFGTDYKNYYRMYNDYFAYGFSNVEVGTIVLFNVSKWLGWDFKGFLFLTSVLEMIVPALAIRRHCERNVYPLAILFFLTLYFGPSTNIIAQVCALSFLIFAYEYMMKEQWIPVIIFCLIATMFHLSAIVGIIIYLLYVFDNRSRVRIISVVVLAVGLLLAFFPNILYSILNLLGSGYAKYVEYVTFDRINTFFYILVYRVPLYVIEGIYHKQIVASKGINRFYYLLIILEIAGCIMGISMAWIGRLIYFFSIGHVFLCCELINSVKNKGTRVFISTLFVFYYFVAFGFMHFFSEFDGIMNFQLI
ncbi:MAG: EpsG family protein [Lachnospiraceae bacterium]|nr:EpsG family protein [Lachnospiraceae bacterium]MCI8813633.1 EpsG family protein [Lachnospiraceae bacterium]